MSLRIPAVEAINEAAAKNAFRLDELPWDRGTDPSRFYGPEEMSHLYYCPSYSLLTADEKRFYNQVHAGGICEQFVFLEEMLLVRGLGTVLKKSSSWLSPAMREAIHTFIEEEKKHAAMFDRLLKVADPEVYGQTRFAVYVLNGFESGFMKVCLDYPETFLWWIWIAVLFEEKTLDFYRKYLACSAPETLDPLFFAVHRAHAMEEIRHFQLDHHFVDLFWESAPRWKRWFNEQIFRRMMWHFTHPHRTVRYAVLRLLDHFPRLEPMREQLLREIHAVFEDPRWQEAFYSRRVLPNTFALFDRFPELHRLKYVFPLSTPPNPQTDKDPWESPTGAGRHLIVDLTIADWMTVSGYFLVWSGLWCALWGYIPWAISFLTVAMLLDALDGMVARRLGIARPFGRYLGSFVDLVNYTVAPPLLLWRLGFTGPLAVAVLWTYSLCGMLRLAKFNEIGNIQQDGALAYLGLPVFWVHFVLMGLYFVHAVAPPFIFFISTAGSLLLLAYCFILNRPFWKPQNYTFIAAVTLIGAAFFAVLGFFR